MDCLCCKNNIPKNGPRVCPECRQPLDGKGWTGIDGHWKTFHGNVMSYDTFWDSLCEAHRNPAGIMPGVQYAHRYLQFISKHGVGQKDNIASSPESYLSYLRSVSGIIGRIIAPDILKSEDDIIELTRHVQGERATSTISNYRSAMRHYVAMLKEMEQLPVLTSEVIAAWDEVISRHNHSIPADKTGRSSITGLRTRLKPIREDLRDAISAQLPDYTCLTGLKSYYADFWQAGRKGALLKGYIWDYLAPDRAKTRARLQGTFTIERTIKAEYVAYPAADKGRHYDISKISTAIKDKSFFEKFRSTLRELPPGFSISCTTGDGKEIECNIVKLSDADWTALKTTGIATDSYFVIGTNRLREKLLHLTIDQLATLLLEDLSELTRIRNLFDGKPLTTVASRMGYNPSVASDQKESLLPPSGKFRPEFFGTKTYAPPKSPIVADCTHGLVVNALAEALSKQGIRYGRDIFRDLYIYEQNSIQILFEVKTDLETSSIYGAIGQLMLHGSAEEQKPVLVALLPGKPNERTERAFDKLGIHCLTYEMDTNISFPELTGFLTRIKKSDA